MTDALPISGRSPEAPGAADPRAGDNAVRYGFAAAWVGFWVLMIVVAVQDYLRHGGTRLWEPLLWEGSSAAMASVVVWALWRRGRQLDALLPRPGRWLAACAAWLPLAAPLFVAAIYVIRHGVYALLGQDYRHDPWAPLVVYEVLKFSVFYLLFAAIVFGLRSYQALLQARVRLERERALTQRAQLLQLAQQIQPHFLFNALNTIASAIHTDPELADTLLLRLAALLRAATDLAHEPEATLDEELRLLDAYAAIMCQRFGERVELRFEIAAAARACRVPTLLLQPLLENAFRHAVEPRRERTVITVRASVSGSAGGPGDAAPRLALEVENDGPELPAQPVLGVGLTNLRQRLQARHGAQARLSLARGAGAAGSRGALARIEMPCVW